MRPLLFFAALLFVAHAGPNDRWANVFSSFFSDKQAQSTGFDNYHGEIVEPSHVRIKRAVYAALGISSVCGPGWTGQFCENPICDSKGTVGVEQNTDKQVEVIYAPPGCRGQYYVPVDSTSDYLFIQVSTDGAVPWINLTDATGVLVIPKSTYPSTGHNMAFYQPIAPGKYQMVIDTLGMMTTQCIIDVQVASKLDISHGFVASPQSDFPPHGASAVEGQMMNLVVHTYHPEMNAQPGSAAIFTDSNTTSPLFRSTLTKRYGCAYEQFVGGTFTCQKNTLYAVTVDGIDANGYSFRRTKRGWACVTAPPTPTPTPAANVTTCLNGGTLLYAGMPNAQCLCTELWTGSQCQYAQCMNGGTPKPDRQSCLCVTGYSGTNCQDVVCELNFGEFLTDSKSLIIVYRTVSSMNSYVNGIAKAIQDEYDYMVRTPGMEPYREFVLIGFANGGFERQVYRQQDFNKFLQHFTSFNASSVSGQCNDTVVDAVQEVFRTSSYNKSPVYVFTDAPASDYADFLGVTEANSYKKLPIYTFFMNTSSAVSCGVDELAEGYRVMGSLAYMSGGLVLTPANDKYPTTVALTLRATTYKMNQVLIDDLTVCKIDGYRTFFVDSATQYINIVATGENLLISITSPNGTVSSPSIFQDGRNYFYHIPQEQLIRGEYLMQFIGYNSQYPCSYRVYANSDYDLFVAATNFVAVDAVSAEPIYGEPNAIVAQFNGLFKNVTFDPFRLFSEVMIISNTRGMYHKPLYFSNGIYRSGCGYHLYFGTTNFCEEVGQVFYAVVYADDPYGYTIQRTAVGYCSGRAPTQSPPTSCINGGVPNPTNSTWCLCPPLYTGQYCQDLNCQNGGQYTHGTCVCPVGLGGTFCEETRCLVTNTNPPFTPNGRSLTFVVSTISTMNDTWQQLAAGVSDFTRDISQHSPDWIKRYNLILVNQDSATLVKQTDRAQGFIDAIKTVAANLNSYYDPKNPNCTIKLESGILLAAENSFDRSLIFSFFDSDMQVESGTVLLKILAKIESTQTQTNMILTNKAPCPSGTYNEIVNQLALYSGGWIYGTNNIKQMYNFILTEYQSGTIAEFHSNDCTTPQIYYLPVDAFAQSMTIVGSGSNVKFTVWQPDKTPALNSHYELNMIQEDYTRIDQFIIPCPNSEWQYFGNQCYLFNMKQLNFQAASDICHKLGGWMVDIFSQDKQTFIQYESEDVPNWIGLHMVGGAWYWDVPDNAQARPLQDGDFQNWKGGVKPTDQTKPCVYMDKDGTWVADVCATPRLYLCQMLRYGQEIYPKDPTTNLLPAGFWKVSIQTDKGECALQARLQSQIQLFFGFVQDTHMDFPEQYANSNATNNYFVVGATGLSPFHDDRHPSAEGRVNYVYTNFMGNNTNALTFEPRAACSYSMISQNFACATKGSYYEQFFAKFSGLDQYGFTFDRISPSYCGIYTGFCNNGGYVYQGQCICPEGWTGQRCQIPVCLNGGVANADNKCVCPPVFSGSHCQEAQCEPPYPAKFGDKQRTLAIAVETSTLTATSLFLLKKNLAKIIADITAPGTIDEKWFINYILYPFDSTINKNFWYPPVMSNNFTDIMTGLNGIKRGCPNSQCDQQTCPKPYLRVISNIVKMDGFVSPNSEILVITRSSPEDYEIMYDVIGDIQNSRARVYFLLPNTDSPCNEGWNTPGVDAMRTIAEYSQGGIYPLSPTDMTFNWLPTFFPATFASGRLTGGSLSNNCSYAELLFPIENTAHDLLIDYFGTTINLKLYNPMGDEYPLPPNLIQSTTNYLAVLALNDSGVTMAGTWKLIVQDPSNYCGADLRVRSRIEIYPAFTQVNDQYNGATNDDAHFQPVTGSKNIILAHSSSFGGIGSGIRITFAQIVVPRRGLYFTSEMSRRSTQCGYEYYSTKSFDCYMENFLVVLYGIDETGGAPFNRAFVTHCISTRPMPPPPPPSCDLTQTQNDIVFMLDGSVSTKNSIGVLKLFMGNVGQKYSIGSSSTQIGGFTFSVQVPGGNPIMLNSATDYNSLYTKIMAMQADGVAGQNITSAVNYVSSMFTQSSMGYRLGVRHLVVYVTATTTYTDGLLDPIAAVSALRRSGSFGFALVTFGMSKPPDYLTSMAGPRCTYHAMVDDDLAVYATNFIQTLSCMRVAVCGM